MKPKSGARRSQGGHVETVSSGPAIRNGDTLDLRVEEPRTQKKQPAKGRDSSSSDCVIVGVARHMAARGAQRLISSFMASPTAAGAAAASSATHHAAPAGFVDLTSSDDEDEGTSTAGSRAAAKAGSEVPVGGVRPGQDVLDQPLMKPETKHSQDVAEELETAREVTKQAYHANRAANVASAPEDGTESHDIAESDPLEDDMKAETSDMEDASGSPGSADSGISADSQEIVNMLIDQIDSDDDGLVESSQTPEHKELVKYLHTEGVHEFVEKYIESGRYTVAQLCSSFGCPVEMFSDLSPAESEHASLMILGRLLRRELHRRVKLEQYNTIDDAAGLLRNAKRILVLTGAGISTSLGIPDFRSKNGLYNQLAASGLADKVDDPQDVFSLHVFKEDPTIFYSVAKSILSSDKRFSPTHAFIKLLQDKHKLLTNFTQNIDNLEAAAGIRSDKLVHCHGSFATATCQKCGHRVPGDDIHDQIRAGELPRCKRCLQSMTVGGSDHDLSDAGISDSLSSKRKRSSTESSGRVNLGDAFGGTSGGGGGGGPSKPSKKHKQHNGKKKKKLNPWDDSDDSGSDDSANNPFLTPLDRAGVMKPDIVFFGEDLPSAFHDRAMADKDVVDLVIVIGTSLKVAPVSEVPNFIPSDVPQIYISRDPCKHINFDIELLGECDVVVDELCRRAGWDLRHEMLPAVRPRVEVSALEGWESRHEVAVVGSKTTVEGTDER